MVNGRNLSKILRAARALAVRPLIWVVTLEFERARDLGVCAGLGRIRIRRGGVLVITFNDARD
jgi:hypothetical protein